MELFGWSKMHFDKEEESTLSNKKTKASKSMLNLLKQKEIQDESEIERKAHFLTHKLTFTLLSKKGFKQSKATNNRIQHKSALSGKTNQQNHEISRLKSKLETIKSNFSQTFEPLSKDITQISKKYQNSRDQYTAMSNANRVQLQILNRTLDEIKSKSSILDRSTKKECNQFTNILHRNNLKGSAIINNRSRLFNSLTKDSLLLSFKRNIEEDDGCMTLKYSEESNNNFKNKLLTESNCEAYQIYNLPSDNKDRVKKRLSFKEKDDPAQEKQTEIASLISIVSSEFLNSAKTSKSKLQESKNEIQNALKSFEQILDKVVEEIAEQKVQANQQWNEIINNTSKCIDEIGSALNFCKSTLQDENDELSTKLSTLETDFLERLMEEKLQRRKQEKMMVKMMGEMVEALQ